MRAAEGAVERVLIDGDNVDVHTITTWTRSASAARNLDAIAQLMKAKLLTNKADSPGRILACVDGGTAEFVLVPANKSRTGRDVRVTRRDVNEIQLASPLSVQGQKSSWTARESNRGYRCVRGGWRVRTYLDVDSAVTSHVPAYRSRALFSDRNAAGTGARAC